MCYKRTGYKDMPQPRTAGRLSVSHVHPSIHLFPRDGQWGGTNFSLESGLKSVFREFLINKDKYGYYFPCCAWCPKHHTQEWKVYTDYTNVIIKKQQIGTGRKPLVCSESVLQQSIWHRRDTQRIRHQHLHSLRNARKGTWTQADDKLIAVLSFNPCICRTYQHIII